MARRIAISVALLATATLGSLIVGELAVRRIFPSPTGHYVYTPGLTATFEPRSESMPGVSGPTRFHVNALGLRGDEVSDEHAYRILAVGGSTTQCLYLDQEEAWPGRLQVLLRGRIGDDRVWVGNAGKAGRYSSEHVLQVERLLARLGDVDVLVMLLGANDAYRRLAADDRYEPLEPGDPDDREKLTPRAFEVYPRDFAWLPPRKTAIWGLLDHALERRRNQAAWSRVEDRAGSNYERWRRMRAEAAGYRDAPPDLAAALGEYTRNLTRLSSLAREHSVRVIFLTQPTIYRSDLSASERKLLWMGRIGDPGAPGENEYYTVDALARVFADYNAAMLRFCSDTAAECIDLASRLPKDTRSFYDDVHYNESGSERVAQALFDHLVVGPPFVRPAAAARTR